MSQPTLPYLRPLTLGEILDHSVRLYRRNFLDFIGILALVLVPMTVFRMILFEGMLKPWLLARGAVIPPGNEYSSGLDVQYLEMVFGQIFSILELVVMQCVAATALTRAVCDTYLGKGIDMIEAYKRLGLSWLRMFGVLLLFGLVLVAAGIWTLVPCIGWLTGAGLVLYLYMVVFQMLTPAVVLENRGASALRRAWDLCRRRFWWMLSVSAIVFLFSQIIIIGPTAFLNVLVTYFLAAGSDIPNQTLIATILGYLIGLASRLFYVPLQITALTLVYFDLRVRTEGFDLLLQAGEMQMPGIEPARLVSAMPPTPRTSLVNSKEITYFLGLTLLGVGVPVGLYALLVFLILALL